MSNEKLKPGDVLYDSELNEYPVTKVGTKYAYFKGRYNERKTELHHLQDSDYRGRYVKLYRSKQEVSDSNEAEKLFDHVCKRITQHYNYKSANLTLAQLRQIAEVLGIENKS